MPPLDGATYLPLPADRGPDRLEAAPAGSSPDDERRSP